MCHFRLAAVRAALFSLLVLFASLAVPVQRAEALPTLPDFSEATFKPSADIDNPYFPMTWKETRIFESGKSGDRIRDKNQGKKPKGKIPDQNVSERFELTNLGPGPVILGIKTRIQLDRAFENNLLVEETFDYFAQDTRGNVWYFGEDVTNYIYDKRGNLIETNNESAWRAGVHGAKPGFIMPAELIPGFNYFQEFAPEDEAVDQATIWKTGLTVRTILGNLKDVVQILETNELEPDAREFKYYAPGIGLIRAEEGLRPATLDKPETIFSLTKIVPGPEEAGLLMMLAGFGVLGIGLRWKRS